MDEPHTPDIVVRMNLLWDLVEILLAEIIEHNYRGDSIAFYRDLTPAGKAVIDKVATERTK